VAEARGGKCLSKKYTNISSHLRWQCEFWHTWKASFGGILNTNTWCPECALFKTQRELTEIIREIYDGIDVLSCFNDFEWLRDGAGRKQEIDIYIPELKLAVEYDGEQHFKPVRFGGICSDLAKRKFEKQKQMDILKNKKITQHPEDVKYFIRFNFREKNKFTKYYVQDKLIKTGIPAGGKDDKMQDKRFV